MLGEKRHELAERDEVHPIVHVELASAQHDEEFLRLGGARVGYRG
jgi:hypothetical protein